jgi:uncharacterized membrane protein YkvA (DUF1232 family)
MPQGTVLTFAGVACGVVGVWLAMLGVMWWVGGRIGVPLREAMRLVPDVVRLLRRLAVDTTLPRGVRVRLWLLLGYLVCPIDLVPDFIPVLGYADDVIIALVAVRSIVRKAGTPAIERHWPGTPEGLASLLVLTQLTR